MNIINESNGEIHLEATMKSSFVGLKYIYIQGGGKDSRIDEMNTAGTYNLYCKLVEYTVTENGQHLLRFCKF